MTENLGLGMMFFGFMRQYAPIVSGPHGGGTIDEQQQSKQQQQQTNKQTNNTALYPKIHRSQQKHHWALLPIHSYTVRVRYLHFLYCKMNALRPMITALQRVASSSQQSNSHSVVTLAVRHMSKYLSNSATKRLPLSTKRAGKGYYKGKGGTKEGHVTSKGKFIHDPAKRLRLVVPDLEGFKVRTSVLESLYPLLRKRGCLLSQYHSTEILTNKNGSGLVIFGCVAILQLKPYIAHSVSKFAPEIRR